MSEIKISTAIIIGMAQAVALIRDHPVQELLLRRGCLSV